MAGVVDGAGGRVLTEGNEDNEGWKWRGVIHARLTSARHGHDGRDSELGVRDCARLVSGADWNSPPTLRVIKQLLFPVKFARKALPDCADCTGMRQTAADGSQRSDFRP